MSTPTRILAAAALALAALPGAAVATKPAPRCPLIVSPVGSGVVGAQLDIKSADVASGRRTVVVVVRLASLTAPDPEVLAGAMYEVTFTVGRNSFALFAGRGTGGGFHTGDGLVVDTAAGTITWTLPRSAVRGLDDKPRQEFRNIRVTTSAGPVGALPKADDASALRAYVDRAPGCVHAD